MRLRYDYAAAMACRRAPAMSLPRLLWLDAAISLFSLILLARCYAMLPVTPPAHMHSACRCQLAAGAFSPLLDAAASCSFIDAAAADEDDYYAAMLDAATRHDAASQRFDAAMMLPPLRCRRCPPLRAAFDFRRLPLHAA